MAAHEHVAADLRHESAKLLAAEGEPGAGLLQLVGDHVGLAGVAPQHLEADVLAVEGRQVLPLLGEQGVARDAGVHEQHLVEQQHVGHGVEEVEEAREHVDGQQAGQAVDRLGRAHAAVHLALVLDVVLVVAAQHEHVLRHGQEQVEDRAQHAVVAEAAAVDVVAEQDQADVGVVLGVGPEAADLLHEVRLVDRGLEAAVTAVEVAEDDQLVVAAGLARHDIHVLVEELLAAGEVGDVLVALELPAAAHALGLPGLLDPVEQLEVGGELLAEALGVGGVVMLELGEEGVVVLRRDEGDRRLDLDAADDVEGALVDHELGVEELGEVVAKRDLLRVGGAVGVDQAVDDDEQGLAVVVAEPLEQLEAAQLELREHEALGVLAVGDGLGQQALDVAVDLLEALDVVLVLGLDALEAELVLEGTPGVDAGGHQLAQEGADERLLAQVELGVDVAAGRQVKDDRLDLLLGDGRDRG